MWLLLKRTENIRKKIKNSLANRDIFKHWHNTWHRWDISGGFEVKIVPRDFYHCIQECNSIDVVFILHNFKQRQRNSKY